MIICGMCIPRNITIHLQRQGTLRKRLGFKQSVERGNSEVANTGAISESSVLLTPWTVYHIISGLGRRENEYRTQFDSMLLCLMNICWTCDCFAKRRTTFSTFSVPFLFDKLVKFIRHQDLFGHKWVSEVLETDAEGCRTGELSSARTD